MGRLAFLFEVAAGLVLAAGGAARGQFTDQAARVRAMQARTPAYEYMQLRSEAMESPLADELLVQVESDRRCDLSQYRDSGDPLGAKIGSQLLDLLRGPKTQVADDLLNAEALHQNWAALNPVLENGDTAVRARVLVALPPDQQFFHHMAPGFSAAFGDPDAAVRLRCLTTIIPSPQMAWTINGAFGDLFGRAFSDPDPAVRKVVADISRRGDLMNERGFLAAVIAQAKVESPLREAAWQLLGSTDRMRMGMAWMIYKDDPAFDALVLAAMMDPNPTIRMNSHYLWDNLHPFALTPDTLLALTLLTASVILAITLGVWGQFRYPALARPAGPAPEHLGLSVMLGHVAGILIVAGTFMSLALWWFGAGFSHYKMALIGAALAPLLLLGYATVNWTIAGRRGEQFDYAMQAQTLWLAAGYGGFNTYLHFAALKRGQAPGEWIALASIAIMTICIVAALSWTRAAMKSGLDVLVVLEETAPAENRGWNDSVRQPQTRPAARDQAPSIARAGAARKTPPPLPPSSR